MKTENKIKKLEDFVQIERNIYHIYRSLLKLEYAGCMDLDAYNQWISYLEVALEVEEDLLERWKLSKAEIKEIIKRFDVKKGLFEYEENSIFSDYFPGYFELNDIDYIIKYSPEEDITFKSVFHLAFENPKNPILRRVFLKIMNQFFKENKEVWEVDDEIAIYPQLSDGFNEFVAPNRYFNAHFKLMGEIEKVFVYNLSGRVPSPSMVGETETFMKELKYMLAFINPEVEGYLTSHSFGLIKPLPFPNTLLQIQNGRLKSFLNVMSGEFMGNIFRDTEGEEIEESYIDEIIFEMITYSNFLSSKDISYIMNEAEKAGSPNEAIQKQMQLILSAKSRKE